MDKRKPITTEQRTKRRQQAVRKKQVLGVKLGILASVILALIIIFIRLPFFRIRTIEVEGNQLIKTEDVQTLVGQEFKGTHGLFVPNGHIFLMQRDVVEERLHAAFPRISDVRIERTKFHSLLVVVEERPHAYLWCPDVQLSDCYFSDDSGLLFAQAPYFSGTVFLTFTGGDVDRDSPIDTRILNDAEEFKKLVMIMNAFDDTGFVVESVAIRTRHEYAIVVSRINGERTPDADIVVTTLLDPAVTLSNIALAMDTDKFKRAFAASAVTLDYIDARLFEKVFYKFGLSQTAPPATTSVTQ